MVMTSVTKGFYYYGHHFRRYRVRWSMHTHSLVPGDVYYSPYAYKPGHSGLVPYWVRYSPYAYSYQHPSGLVNDYASSTRAINYYPYNYRYTGSARCAYDRGNSNSNPNQARATYAEKLEARNKSIKWAARPRNRQIDPKQIIAQYLKSKNIDFGMNRILQIEGKTISVDFLLKDKNIILKYWNPVEILALEQQPQYKKMFYEKYLETWGDFCAKYQNSGGKIYQIITADTKEILAKLTLFQAQNGEIVYALNQTQP
jgi:hypothetical protein